jgi:cysteine-rich repeat protein
MLNRPYSTSLSPLLALLLAGCGARTPLEAETDLADEGGSSTDSDSSTSSASDESGDAGTTETGESTTGPGECGNGIVEGDEECDDSNEVELDGCDASCNLAPNHLNGLDTGGTHTCAIGDEGQLRCWGSGENGRLGYGNTQTIGDDEPASAAGDVDVGGAVKQVVTGSAHTCALLHTGQVRCWGYGYWGRLGYGNTQDIGDDETPASAGDVDLGGPVNSLAAGYNHTCAIMQSGNVRCWGHGGAGQLGYGNTEAVGDDETPASMGDVSLPDVVIALALGQAHSCAILKDGTAQCWGEYEHGKIGFANQQNVGDDELPTSGGPIDVGGTVAQISAGAGHTCALLTSGGVLCWGSAFYSALGYQNEEHLGDDEPEASGGALDLGTGLVRGITTTTTHNCALMQGDTLRCWGNNADGKLGYGHANDIGDDEAPGSGGDVSVGGPVAQVATGNSHTCARLTSGALRCWGRNESGQLGYGHTESIGDDESAANAGDVPWWP